MLATLNEVMPANELSLFRQILEFLIADFIPLTGFKMHHLTGMTGFMKKHNQASILRHEF